MQFDATHLYDERRPSPLDAFNPRCRVLCALSLSAVLASAQSWPGLLAGSVVPLCLFFAGGAQELRKTLIHVNAVTIFACLLLPLTTPGPRLWGVLSVSGLRLALIFAWKLNLLCVVLVRMVAALGVEKISGVLDGLRVPQKMSVLLLLTIRYTFLLTERVAAMTRAIRLRAPELRGGRLCSAFACMLGTTLIHSSDRAERSMLAMRCRGGMAGFSQGRPACWRPRDTALCVFFALSVGLVAVFSR